MQILKRMRKFSGVGRSPEYSVKRKKQGDIRKEEIRIYLHKDPLKNN